MKISLVLVKKYPEVTDTITFLFQPEEKFDYTAGQFLKYTLPHSNPDDRGIQRYFTIVSAPSEGFVQISTRFSQKSSTFKQALKNMEPGDKIQAEGPMGSFTFDETIPEMVWIAGGIGITPFRSILKQLDHDNLNPKITLLYANRSADIPFKELIDEFKSRHNNFKVIYTQERLGEDFIKNHVPDLGLPTFYVSGPEPLVESLMEMLTNMGIEKNKLKRDAFPGYEWDQL